MDIRAFAKRERLKTRRDEVNEEIIPGRGWKLQAHRIGEEAVLTSRGSHIYEHGDGRLAATFLKGTPRTWGFRKRRGLAVGMELHQDGDEEGTLLFDPSRSSTRS